METNKKKHNLAIVVYDYAKQNHELTKKHFSYRGLNCLGLWVSF